MRRQTGWILPCADSTTPSRCRSRTTANRSRSTGIARRRGENDWVSLECRNASGWSTAGSPSNPPPARAPPCAWKFPSTRRTRTPVRRSLVYRDGEAPMAKITVLLADDHTLVRQGLRVLLEAQPDIAIAGEAGTGREAVQLT